MQMYPNINTVLYKIDQLVEFSIEFEKKAFLSERLHKIPIFFVYFLIIEQWIQTT